MIPALVLTAGLATRLRPLSLVRAKSALPVAGDPLVRRILRWLAGAGITDAVLNLHHLPHSITTLIGDGSDVGVRVRYSWERVVLGSAGGPRRALSLLGGPTFLIVNGDTLTDFDVTSAIDRHQSTGAMVTMALVANTEPEKYGGVLVDDDDVVTGFCRRGSSQPSYHFFGVQVVQASVFAALPDDVPSESVGALYPKLMAEHRGAVRAFRCSAEYLDIGTPQDYLATSLLLAERESCGAAIGRGARIASNARIERCVLWDDVVVEDGAMLRECIVTDGARVPADTSWHGVSLRVPTGELAPGEKIVEGLAISSI
jgi:mannose-1-phosphate guanylyltransferase